MKGSTSCRICGTWLEGAWNRADRMRIKALKDLLQEQMNQGMCTRCAVKRESTEQLLARLDRLEARLAREPQAGEWVDHFHMEYHAAIQEVAFINIEFARRSAPLKEES